SRIVHQWYVRAAAERDATAAQIATQWQTMQRGVPPLELVPPVNETLPGLLIQAKIITLGDRTNEGQLVEAIAIPWFEILRELERNPSFLYEIARDWRKVEELVAGGYKREGWPEVVLTPRSGDKGRD